MFQNKTLQAKEPPKIVNKMDARLIIVYIPARLLQWRSDTTQTRPRAQLSRPHAHSGGAHLCSRCSARTPAPPWTPSWDSQSTWWVCGLVAACWPLTDVQPALRLAATRTPERVGASLKSLTLKKLLGIELKRGEPPLAKLIQYGFFFFVCFLMVCSNK